jgi:hypothetical protein
MEHLKNLAAGLPDYGEGLANGVQNIHELAATATALQRESVLELMTSAPAFPSTIKQQIDLHKQTIEALEELRAALINQYVKAAGLTL